jgi:hypothetical protein
MTENAPIDGPKPKGIPADVPFLRTIKSYVLRAGRTTIGQAKAYGQLFNLPAQFLGAQYGAGGKLGMGFGSLFG